MLLILLIVLLLFSVGGGVGYSRYGYVGMSPAALVLIILVILYFTGNLGHR